VSIWGLVPHSKDATPKTLARDLSEFGASGRKGRKHRAN